MLRRAQGAETAFANSEAPDNGTSLTAEMIVAAERVSEQLPDYSTYWRIYFLDHLADANYALPAEISVTALAPCLPIDDWREGRYSPEIDMHPRWRKYVHRLVKTGDGKEIRRFFQLGNISAHILAWNSGFIALDPPGQFHITGQVTEPGIDKALDIARSFVGVTSAFPAAVQERMPDIPLGSLLWALRWFNSREGGSINDHAFEIMEQLRSMREAN